MVSDIGNEHTTHNNQKYINLTIILVPGNLIRKGKCKIGVGYITEFSGTLDIDIENQDLSCQDLVLVSVST